MVRLKDGSTQCVDDIEMVELPEGEYVAVYNFEVADFHTYFVSDYDVLVHNKCTVDTDPAKNKKLGSITGYKAKKGIDLDYRNTGKDYRDALNTAFEKTGVDRSDFKPTKWGKNKYGKSFPAEWRSSNGACVNIDYGHKTNGPDVPHIGYKYGKKAHKVVGHIFVDSVPYNR